MPIYGYTCKSCNHTLDALQKMSDAVLVECPECGKPELKRLLSAPRFRLKGKGWYETDFKKDNQRNILQSDAKSEAETKSASESKSEPAKDAKTKNSKDSGTPAKSAGSNKTAAK